MMWEVIRVSDWEEFCESKGWKNDDTAYDKLDGMINSRQSDSSLKKHYAPGRKFSPQKGKKYVNINEEERRLLEKPAAKVVTELLGWGIKKIRENEIRNNGDYYKTLTILAQQSNMEITAVITQRDNTFEVYFDDSLADLNLVIVQGPRLTRTLIHDAYVQWLDQWNPTAADHHRRKYKNQM